MVSGTSVHPNPPIQAAWSPSRSRTKLSRWAWLIKLFRTWKQLQVTYYGGRYSIHRLLALQEYTKTTSLFRVFLVCIGTPMPTVALVLVQESIPLQDPAKGWQENYGFWIRAAILAIVIARVVVNQTQYFIGGINTGWAREVLVCICTSAAFTVVSVLISTHLMFPVPFFLVSDFMGRFFKTLAPLFYVMYTLSFCVVLGRRTFHQVTASRRQLMQYIYFLVAQNSMVVTYPAYETLFRVAQGTQYQLPVIFLLPVIKTALKNVVLRCAVHMEDMAPEAVIFTVDFFNAVYVSTCMQSASSLVSVVAITATDLFQTSIMLYGLHKRTATLLPGLYQVINHDTDATLVGDSLLDALCSLCRDPEMFEAQVCSGVRLYSCLPHELSPERKDLLKKLAKIPHGYSVSRRKMSGLLDSERLHLPWARNRVEAIQPIVVNAPNRALASPTRSFGVSKRTHSFTNRAILQETLEALFSMGCLVATSYLEAATPLLYCCYVLVMVHLPSARYHTEMAGVTVENVGSKILFLFIFGLLQIASFVLLVVVVKRNCGMHALYHLAFVLKTQVSLIQGKLMAWMVVTLCFRVVHFGVDFTFHFDRQTSDR